MAEHSELVLRAEVDAFIASNGSPKRTKEHGEFLVLYYDHPVHAIDEVDVLLATNVRNLASALEQVTDAEVVEKARKKDSRSTAGPKYAARLAELEA